MQVDALVKTRNVVGEKKRTGHVTATAERIAQAGGLEATEQLPPQPGHRAGQRILAAPLDRLWKEKKISGREYLAGERYRSDAYLSAVDPSTGSIDWERAGGGGRGRYVPTMFTHQACAEARIRWRRIANVVTGIVDQIVDMTLIKERPIEDVGLVIFRKNNQPQAIAAGLAGFRVALATLADIYDSFDEPSRKATVQRSAQREANNAGGRC